MDQFISCCDACGEPTPPEQLRRCGDVCNMDYCAFCEASGRHYNIHTYGVADDPPFVLTIEDVHETMDEERREKQ